MAGKGTVKNHDRKAAINFNIIRKYRSKTVARKYRSKHLPGAESARSPRTPRSEDSAQSATDCRRRGSAAQAATGPSCQSAQSIMMARAEPPRAARPPESARAAARRLPMTLCKRHSQTVCGPVTSSRQTSRLHCNTATLRRLQVHGAVSTACLRRVTLPLSGLTLTDRRSQSHTEAQSPTEWHRPILFNDDDFIS